MFPALVGESKLEVDIMLTIDAAHYTGVATLTRQSHNTFAVTEETGEVERWLAGDLLELRSLLSAEQYLQVLQEIERKAIKAAAGSSI